MAPHPRRVRAGRIAGAVMPPYLAIDNVSVAYDGTRVLTDVTLDVARGELVALLGSSGCGKTTLLRSIAGFVTPQAGRIRVDGRDITPLPPEKRGTAMMFQSYALWPHMTVAGNIAYGLRMRGASKEAIARRVDEMLALLQLQGFGPRPVTQLSGGQRQRVALGRALAVDPDLLLLDEPMSNLDYKVRIELRHELRALQKRIGITAVYVTHDSGKRWKRLDGGLPRANAYLTVKRQAMVGDGADPLGLYFGTTNGEVWASRNEGRTWSCIARHLPHVLALEAVELRK